MNSHIFFTTSREPKLDKAVTENGWILVIAIDETCLFYGKEDLSRENVKSLG